MKSTKCLTNNTQKDIYNRDTFNVYEIYDNKISDINKIHGFHDDPAGDRFVNVCRHLGSRESSRTARKTHSKKATYSCYTHEARRQCPHFHRRKQP